VLTHKTWAAFRKDRAAWKIYMKNYRRTHKAKPRWRDVGPPKQPRDWLSIDGEGWGEDEYGRQCYRFMVAATADGFEDVLHCRPGEDRLRTVDILEWLCWLCYRYVNFAQTTKKIRKAKRPRVCGFGLGYDHAHIVLDFSLEQLKELFHNQDPESAWVEYEGYRLKLTAGRLQVKRFERGQQRGYVDVWDTFKYFQSAFAKASKKIATDEEKELIAKGKERRGDTEHNLQEEVEYALTECRVHARLMATVEAGFRELELYPRSWYGPGSAAHMALKKFHIEEHHVPDEELNAQLIEAARRSFIGGRFETTGHGRLPFLMAYDINSAYPHAITKLPCLAHTTWKQVDREHLLKEVVAHGLKEVLPFWSLIHVKWDNHGEPLKGGWGPWPSRIKPHAAVVGIKEDNQPEEYDYKMLPVWPWKGETWVWGPEFRAGVKLLAQSPKATWDIIEAWIPETTCDCKPFTWVEEWYYWRQQLQQQENPMEQWVKLILNSLYGKMAQQVGKAMWHSWLWASMITSHCRAQLLETICLDPEAVVMTATDAVYSRRGLNIQSSEELGQWKPQALGRVLIVQSGFFDSEAIYGEDKPRTRGIPSRYVDWAIFHRKWDDVLAGKEEWDLARVVIDHEPETGKPFQIHIGIGLAQLWNKPEMLGRWHFYPMEITFATDKRPLPWDAPKQLQSPEWRNTRPWELSLEISSEYREGKGIGEDKYLVTDQPNSSEWGEI
jgi:hypothetical protein